MPLTTIFFRDDDVGLLSPGLRTFVDVMMEAGVPVNYQVIPARVTPEAARWLRGRRAAPAGGSQKKKHGHRQAFQ
jgi:hypothetical protein